MIKKKIAIVGSSGYIASYLLRMLKNESCVSKILKIDQVGDFDVFINLEDATKHKYDFLNDIDIVIFTAAISGPDKCASDYDFCWKINVDGTSYFISQALKKKCKVLFFSSDAVFGDVPGAIYDENSLTCAKTPYGKMKKAIEDQFKNNFLFKAIRLSYVVSANDRFTKYCLSCVTNNEMADVFHPFYRNSITVSDVVNVVKWMVNNWDIYPNTFLNIAGPELVSRVRIADEINRITGGKLKYIISQPDEVFFTNRPKITQMKSKYLYEYKIIEEKTFSEKIQYELKEIKL